MHHPSLTIEQSPLCRPFFAGAYSEVLAMSMESATVAHPYVIGALALSGRLDEASAATSIALSADSGLEETERVAVRFFLTIGYCHAGRLKEALRLARRSLDGLSSSDPTQRFYAAQGLGMVRFFEGKMAKATLFAKRALQASMLAGLSYGRFLALDLRGHILVQLGHFYAGLRLLEQAKRLASDMDAKPNTLTVEAAILTYHASRQADGNPEKVDALQAFVEIPELSFFARRNGLYQLAWSYALQGSRTRAESALKQAEAIALPDGDTRGRLRYLLARIAIQTLGVGGVSLGIHWEEARRLAGTDPALQVELLFARAICKLRAFATDAELSESLYRRTGIQRAQIASLMAQGDRDGLPMEDPLGETLCVLSKCSITEQVAVLIESGLLGLLPQILQQQPGCRIVISGDHMLVENHGEVRVARTPKGPSLRLLYALARTPGTRAELLAQVWGIAKYVSHLHDSTLHTAVARLRSSLGDASSWVLTTSKGYGLSSQIELVTLSDPHPELDGDVAPEQADRIVACREAGHVVDRHSLLVKVLATGREANCTEISDLLDISKASTLRLLREMVAGHEIERLGKGKATRYRLLS